MVIRFDGRSDVSAANASSFKMTIRISPEQIEIGGLLHDNFWPDETPMVYIPDETVPEEEEKQEPSLLDSLTDKATGMLGNLNPPALSSSMGMAGEEDNRPVDPSRTPDYPKFGKQERPFDPSKMPDYFEGNENVAKKIEDIRRKRLDKEKRIEELSYDPDTGKSREREGQAAYDLEEKHGYFERYERKDPSAPKGDFISVTTGETYDHIGLPDDEKTIRIHASNPRAKEAFFRALDKHFLEADNVILDIEHIKKYEPELHQEIMDYIDVKYGRGKLVEYKP